jgi:hypothetical protein
MHHPFNAGLNIQRLVGDLNVYHISTGSTLLFGFGCWILDSGYCDLSSRIKHPASLFIGHPPLTGGMIAISSFVEIFSSKVA